MSRFNRTIHGADADTYFVSVGPRVKLYPGVAFRFPDGFSNTGRRRLRKAMQGGEWWWR